MADRFATQITIGGTFTLTDENLESFENFVYHFQELAPDWGEKHYYLPVITELDEAINDGGFIYGCDDEKAYGNFEDIEILCQELGLQYDRNHGPKYEYPGENVSWRPGMEKVHECLCDDDGNRYLVESQINQVLINELSDENIASLADRISNAKNKFEELLNGGVAIIEPFVLIDNRTATVTE